MTKTFTTLTAAAVLLFAAGAAGAADLKASKSVEVAAPAPSMFDLAFGSSLASDYMFRGISQSNHKPSASAYFEPRINFNPNLQGYVGIAGTSIDFPNRAAAEIDLYGGIRPTFGKLALDLGGIYYWYPGGQCYSPGTAGCVDAFTNGPNTITYGNVAKKNFGFFEGYAKGTYTFSDMFAVGANIYATDSWLNTGATGIYYSGTAKVTLPSTPKGVGTYVSAELGRQQLGTTDAFYGIPKTAYANGTPLPDYTTWNIGVGFTYKVFTLDFRYYDTDLTKAECNVLTVDHTATFGGADAITPINPGGGVSKWCGPTFLAKLSVDLTMDSLK